ncbi:gamma-butyrobetaine hydroxylase-like domain-containing protein [Burkholderia sp. WSM2230]|uniref:gamma-butyrobetaine hydroxylase-like domain-containing protein n=1 Tax=Burkholderia sp. WSM2230 TaxID=944435 RepID=UPI00040DDBD2|nr:gamma-butyrobetaine hydroxylase-like domain-containing protein [Burkholderia sp. WSM2230]
MSVPDHVAIDSASASLSMRWPDGFAAQLPFAALRSACMCAQCRKRKLDELLPLSSPGVKLLDVRPWGYGLQLVFDDGHERGIFPWVYLERLAKGE